ncbi:MULTISPECIES: NAD-dependent epimerase/dehydratase family protein [unclassified Sphingomonas]|uniref:NAD-dependent epimerase/dehydratase family protein n=1 Tax=unclassified Sphingomonas TaxID=196159 RepID=UPI002150ECC5|nr:MULTISPECIES: NAD-dependent epimerase/dehydratase family protein [unclassified Sphingomonas]MCR5871140.1 NAD-dependent epimerase/dehydratase family protein [Sphingomonas sp. J344]UUY00546.1 NAD-dependent epimerase/dehydratase family protein [Sphingomonas sp. J315]
MNDLTQRRVLVTGSAGFVGFHTASLLLQSGAKVLGIDNFTPYYDVSLKERRNAILANHPNFELARISIEDAPALEQAWRDFAPDALIHLAAQAGVRYSIEQPAGYVGTNILGTFNLFELARHNPVRHFLAASTSSVYGSNTAMPFDELQRTQTPISLYAATKGATELIGHSYAHLFGIPMTFFRFFTVYGPWGRPDMALFKFADAMLRDAPIDVFNNGEMKRDFTYIDDLVRSIVDLLTVVPGKEPVMHDSLSPVAPFRVVNIGGGKSTSLTEYIAALEAAMGKAARKNFLPIQAGDVPATEASPELLRALIGRVPETTVRAGVAAFVRWYLDEMAGSAS